jgi:bacterioferritin
MRLEWLKPIGFAASSPGANTKKRRVTMSNKSSAKRALPFITDIKTLRERARKNLGDGGITHSYEGDPKKAIAILQSVLATEIVCVLRYTMHAVAATGISSDAVKEEFDKHAKEETEHARAVAERINQLGGKPDFNPTGLESRAAS